MHKKGKRQDAVESKSEAFARKVTVVMMTTLFQHTDMPAKLAVF